VVVKGSVAASDCAVLQTVRALAVLVNVSLSVSVCVLVLSALVWERTALCGKSRGGELECCARKPVQAGSAEFPQVVWPFSGQAAMRLAFVLVVKSVLLVL
jgi:hypothetical protein